jgi:phosphatidylethanolamine/phosphatidyl-N-methylethanolamine N-methyltransferase
VNAWSRTPLRALQPGDRSADLSGPLLPFWRALRADPRRVGALVPSGPALAQAMLDLTLAEPPGHVIEIGAGTGAITRVLARHSQAFASLHVMECDQQLAAGLRLRFPETPIHACCASHLDELHVDPIDRLTLVSSIPFGSLTPADSGSLLAAIARQTAKTRVWRLLQYSYGGRMPFRPDSAAHRWQRLHTVWRNLPPATLWQLSPAAPGAPGLTAVGPSSPSGR